MFKDYFTKKTKNTDILYYNFMGIDRKTYPKWEGWKIINSYKENNIDIKDIKDDRLNILVQNFYYLLYLREL